jgi:hypothetical protein
MRCATWSAFVYDAGPNDPRLPKAVWRGSTGGFGGLVKGRAALLNLGLERPDLIDSGVLDWDAAKYGDDQGRLKEKMSFGEQVVSGMPACCLFMLHAIYFAANCSILSWRQTSANASVHGLLPAAQVLSRHLITQCWRRRWTGTNTLCGSLATVHQ